ncbi:Uma2 family endonuclease [Myxacorys almedinensis]|uniref:Uma2 family endonuclease n=1 Tax=Myxacorys almedinensis A TaxID=2690445 RepID=A0A8J8CNH5_9CYAN|nr:Uma2 family endonuclease [Myxacorys almedinensis]NDJ18437.1 Uma2 family endonuclease [Myxacorys almedinensis A]
MTQAKQRFLSFDEYLTYDDGTEALYELFNGELIEVPPESGQNTEIAVFLLLQFAAIVGHLRVRPHGLELEVRGEPRNRYPGLTILREEHVSQLQRRNMVRLSMAPPLLVVEVVSPGELQRDRDYIIAKRSQYGAIAVLEYWIVDPEIEIISVCELGSDEYQVTQFRGSDRIVSATFKDLHLTAEQVLNAGG